MRGPGGRAVSGTECATEVRDEGDLEYDGGGRYAGRAVPRADGEATGAGDGR